MIFDTHAHYDDKQFDQDREELLASMKDNGIGTIVDVGSNMETSTWIFYFKKCIIKLHTPCVHNRANNAILIKKITRNRF